MSGRSLHGWRALTDGFPWFEGPGRFPLPAYSEFMPPPRLGLTPYGGFDATLFAENDPYGWRVQEVDEVHQILPGLQNVANQVMAHLLKFMADPSSVYVAGPNGRNLEGNPYWSTELAAHGSELARRSHVLLMPLALAKTQDDRGRRHWTMFGGSEQGPERAFWQSFYSAPGREIPAKDSRRIVSRMLEGASGVATADANGLYAAGFRILPVGDVRPFPDWVVDPLPKWTRRYLIGDDARLRGARFVLTFRPFPSLPAAIREAYLSGRIELLPSPFSLLFWGMPIYHHARQQHALALQYSVLRLVGAPRELGPTRAAIRVAASHAARAARARDVRRADPERLRAHPSLGTAAARRRRGLARSAHQLDRNHAVQHRAGGSRPLSQADGA